MKISNTILAVFQPTNEMSAKATHKFMANLDYIFYVCVLSILYRLNDTFPRCLKYLLNVTNPRFYL
jgi:hypothetical protein